MLSLKKFGIIAAIISLSLGTYFLGKKIYENKSDENKLALTADQFSLLVPDHSVKLGPENPTVYLVEFLDPECESCRAFAPLVKSLMSEFEGKIQLVVRYATFHASSELAIKILEASRKQDKYWEVLDVLFQFQPEWGSHHDPRPDLIWYYLPRTGVDIQRLKEDMKDPAISSLIDQDRKDGMTLGITGTPSFFINGKPLQNFGYEPLREMIQKEIENF
jgi:protein-disulfide isomerase